MALRAWAFSGIHGDDDLYYSTAARLFREGHYVQASPWGTRYLLVVPLAVVQALWGVDERWIMLVPMSYSLGTLLLVYALGAHYADRRVGLAAAGLWAILPLDVIQATELHVDLPMTALLSLSLLCVGRAELTSSGRRRLAWLLAAGVAVGLGHLAKELAVTMLAFFALRLLWSRRWNVEWLMVPAGFALVFVVETAWFGLISGQPLYRFSHAVWAGHLVDLTGSSQPPYHWMLDYAELLLNPLTTRIVYTGGFFLPILAAAVRGLAVGDRVVGELALWGGFMLFAFNFAPLDPSFRDPLFHHYARVLHVVFVPGLLILGYTLVRLWPRPVRVLLPLGLVVVALVSVSITRIENQLWGQFAREVVRRSTAEPVPTIVTDGETARQLDFFYGDRAPRIVAFGAGPTPTGGPAWWVYDPFWIAWTRQYWGVEPPPPPRCRTESIADRSAAASVRARLARLDGLLRGVDRVLERWRRAPATLYICDGVLTARAAAR